MEDPGKIYAACLQKQFEQAALPVKLENWSSGGIRTSDIELLSMQAIRRDVDLVIFVLGYSNFDFPDKLDIDYSPSDINLLAGRPSFWRHIKDSSFSKNITYHDIVKRLLFLQSSLVRSRIPAYDRLAEAIPVKQHKYVFGHELEPVIYLDGPYTQKTRDRFPDPTYILQSGQPVLSAISPDRMQQRLETFKDFVPRLNRRLSDNNIDFVWVWMPALAQMFTPASNTIMSVFKSHAADLFKESQIKFFDFRDAIPKEYFFSVNHFDARGHKVLADKLFPIIKHELQ